jgi:hypothetical protein
MDIKPVQPAAALLALVLCVSSGAHAAQTEPQAMEPLFELNPTSTADRSAQTRTLPTADRALLLAASTSVLQDMGFKVTGGSPAYGLLVAEKTADVPPAGLAHTVAEAAVVTTTLLMSLLVGQDMVTDLPEQVQQRVHVSLHLKAVPAARPVRSEVRISIDRDMIYDNGSVLPDHTELPSIYQEFFARLSKSVYLEGELP